MSNLKLEVLLKAVDQATRPFKAVQNASKALSGVIRNSQNTLKDLNAQAGKIDGFRKSSAQLAVTGQKLKDAKAEAAALAIQFKNTANPTRAQAQAMESAKRTAAQLQTQFNGLRQSVQRQRTELSQAGISTRTLSDSERRLKTSISETTAQLNRQRESLTRVSAQQAKLNAVKGRYQAGKQFAGSVTGAGAAGVGIATAGTVAGAGMLKPGYDFALKNSELQATLGLEKDSADMTALRTQARQLGDNTAASADDAAAAQIIVAKSGADKDGILAATPTILNLSLANKRTMEENATLLMGVKSAFGMTNDTVAHIGDVLSAAMNKSAATFDGLSDTMTYAAPVAKQAGISVEETAAMAAALADAKITGSMAGTGARAVITRLQAPTGTAAAALGELKVKTADKKGNMRPLFTILKEMQKSFEKNKLGTSQRAQYMKAIFGEEASSAAAVLMTGASSGKLDELTRALKTSDGKTEELVKTMQDNLGGDFKEFQSAYEAVGTDLFDQQDSSLRKLVQTSTGYVLKLDKWIVNNKALATTLGKIAGGALLIIGALGVFGLVAGPVISGINLIVAAASTLWTVLTIAGGAIATVIGGLSMPLWAVGGIIVGVGALFVAGALLIRKYWEPISAFFAGVVEGLSVAFEPVKELFAPLKPMFDSLGGWLKSAVQWFKDLIAPVKATQDTLNNFKNAGVIVGQGIADAFTWPLKAFNKLRHGVDWLLEKLGIIKDESADIDKTADKADQRSKQSGDGDPQAHSLDNPAPIAPPSGGLLGGGYTPVSVGGGRSYIDRSTHHYTIAAGAGLGVQDTSRQIRAELEARDRARAAQQRSRMDND
ncbi:phage tail tape measure protein [Rahnella variigena]|uniref:phage tail tape measure protein n=1 Tax=Rahnella variigena TaxID=574964 RepID=UPI00244A82E5|nr:phage tail tape measure protein [Rahnella variigena]MDH2899206.1 phage tail tape measure protein [Rahnella variigena]